MNNIKPIILISNDDGYMAKGISALISMVADLGEVIVCAPDSGRSGFSCAFSASLPVTLKRQNSIHGATVYSCSGTPVDCVKVAFDQLFTSQKPTIILSGINHGDNASVNNHYSGTVGVVKEGCMKGIPSVAFSLCDESLDAQFDHLKPIVRSIVKKVMKESLPTNVCLNVNFPVAKTFKGIKICRMANGLWTQEVEEREHPFGHSYYWLAGHYHHLEPNAEDTDKWALNNGYVAITPTTIDVTAYDMIEKAKTWNLELE